MARVGRKDSILLAAQFFADVKRDATADQRHCRWPVMQTQHHSGHHRDYSGDLGHFSDELYVRINDRHAVLLARHPMFSTLGLDAAHRSNRCALLLPRAAGRLCQKSVRATGPARPWKLFRRWKPPTARWLPPNPRATQRSARTQGHPQAPPNLSALSTLRRPPCFADSQYLEFLFPFARPFFARSMP